MNAAAGHDGDAAAGRFDQVPDLTRSLRGRLRTAGSQDSRRPGRDDIFEGLLKVGR